MKICTLKRKSIELQELKALVAQNPSIDIDHPAIQDSIFYKMISTYKKNLLIFQGDDLGANQSVTLLMVKIIAQCENLKHFRIISNNIAPYVKELCDELAPLEKLESLNLLNNNLGFNEHLIIADMLHKSSTILKCNIAMPSEEISPEAKITIDSTIERNKLSMQEFASKIAVGYFNTDLPLSLVSLKKIEIYSHKKLAEFANAPETFFTNLESMQERGYIEANYRSEHALELMGICKTNPIKDKLQNKINKYQMKDFFKEVFSEYLSLDDLIDVASAKARAPEAPVEAISEFLAEFTDVSQAAEEVEISGDINDID